jgi:hypothetical protein
MPCRGTLEIFQCVFFERVACSVRDCAGDSGSSFLVGAIALSFVPLTLRQFF